MSHQFFVYIHSKPDGTPFYVGKGSGNRDRDFSKRNRHHKIIVARYGRENIGVLRFDCDSESAAHEMEVEYIRQFRDAGIKLANVCDGGEGATGAKRSPETRAKMAAAKIGFRFTDEQRKRLSEIHTGKVMSDGMRAKMAERMRGNTVSKGRSPTAETRQKMSAAHIGRKHSEATKRKIGEATASRTWTDASRAKASASQKARFAK